MDRTLGRVRLSRLRLQSTVKCDT